MLVTLENLFRLFINITVEPPLMDTSHRQTPLVSGHLVIFSATYKHYIFNLPKADTSLKRTLFLVPRVSAYRRCNCITLQREKLSWDREGGYREADLKDILSLFLFFCNFSLFFSSFS